MNKPYIPWVVSDAATAWPALLQRIVRHLSEKVCRLSTLKERAINRVLNASKGIARQMNTCLQVNLANGQAGAKPDWRLLRLLTKGRLLTAPGRSFRLHQVQRISDVRSTCQNIIDNPVSAQYHDRAARIMV